MTIDRERHKTSRPPPRSARYYWPEALRWITFIMFVVSAGLAIWIIFYGWIPIVSECGRFPNGRGEALNRALGLWEGCRG